MLGGGGEEGPGGGDGVDGEVEGVGGEDVRASARTAQSESASAADGRIRSGDVKPTEAAVAAAAHRHTYKASTRS